jgi:hypothetical protein
MNIPLPVATDVATALPLLASQSPPDNGSTVFAAPTTLAQSLDQGFVLHARGWRAAIQTAFSGSDIDGSCSWKLAHDACEVALALCLRRFNDAMRERARSPAAFVSMPARIAALVLSQTRRSEESQAQFSAPLTLAFCAGTAASIGVPDIVLGLLAGRGLPRIFAKLAGARVVLNEHAQTRASLLAALFLWVPTTCHDATVVTYARRPHTASSRVRPDASRRDPVPTTIPAGRAQLAYRRRECLPTEGNRITGAWYESYAFRSTCVPGARPHPTRLVRSAAMASAASPKPSYWPRLRRAAA